MKRIQIIEAMRGLAALAVTLFHISAQLPTWKPVFQYGWVGVDVFFVISGFVIPLSMESSSYTFRNFPTFMLRRIVRLEPPYLISLLITVALWHVSAAMPGFRGSPPDYTATQVAAHLFYLIPLTSFEWLNPVYWSLAYEFAFYIFMALTFTSLRDRPPEWIFAAGLGAIAVLYVFTGKVEYRLLEFAAGFIAFRCFITPSTRAFVSICFCGCAIAICGDFVSALATLTAALIIVKFSNLKITNSLLGLGALSYSLYLTHVVVGGRIINFGIRFGSSVWFDTAFLLIAVIASISTAYVFANLVEYPAIKMSRQINSSRVHVLDRS